MYISTRNNYQSVNASQAIKLGMVPNGGLFVPEKIPVIKNLESLLGKSYEEVALEVLSLYLDDYSREEIKACINKAYGDKQNWRAIAPLYRLTARTYFLELWHGPTAAFKDLALQLMPHLLSAALEKTQVSKEVIILVATSGDTGKAALEGFKNVPGLQIVCFYPYQGVSCLQEKQMITTTGKNVHVVGVKGNFDDCQNAVKALFGEQEFRSFLAEKGYLLSSANSINWGRLVPQIVYYVFAYLNLVSGGGIDFGQAINIVVPTGNFGNILAAWYAAQMGVPVGKLICASNENKVLTDFFHSGVYNRQRSLKQTISPSMDILISSNLERFLFEMTERNGNLLSEWMHDLQVKGSFSISEPLLEKIRQILWGGYAAETETLAMINNIYLKSGYLLDPHTAVGMKVYEQYAVETRDDRATIVVSTASPFKFAASVLRAFPDVKISGQTDEFALLRKLSKKSGWSIHPALLDLHEKPILHARLASKTEIKQELLNILGTFIP